MTDIIQSIIAIKSDAQVSVDNDDINKITWHDGNPTNITNDQILAKQTELKTAYNNNKYQRDRATEYPAIVDQLDDIYHNGIDGWKTTIKAIKDKYPKG
jgi:hypothetical protein